MKLDTQKRRRVAQVVLVAAMVPTGCSASSVGKTAGDCARGIDPGNPNPTGGFYCKV